MFRMLAWAVLGFAIGSAGLFALFLVSTNRDIPEKGILFAFSVMGGIPAAAIGVLFGAVKAIQDEMRETRREIKHWQSLFQPAEDDETRSTQFKVGSPPKRD